MQTLIECMQKYLRNTIKSRAVGWKHLELKTKLKTMQKLPIVYEQLEKSKKPQEGKGFNVYLQNSRNAIENIY